MLKNPNRLWKSAFWALALATLWLSLMPAERIPPTLNFWDKAQHALGFAALACLGLPGYAHQARRVVLGLTLFGMAIEVLQHLSGWRHGDWLDWVADCAGLLLGYTVWRLANVRRQ